MLDIEEGFYFNSTLVDLTSFCHDLIRISSRRKLKPKRRLNTGYNITTHPASQTQAVQNYDWIRQILCGDFAQRVYNMVCFKCLLAKLLLLCLILRQTTAVAALEIVT